MSSLLPRGRRRQRKTSQEERICSVCSQAFKKAEHLARHFRSHTKERPFMCQVCGKVYARQDTLLRHSRSHHSKGTPLHGQQTDRDTNIHSEPTLDQTFDATSADSTLLLSEHALPGLHHGSYTATTSSFPHSPEDMPFVPAGDACGAGNEVPTLNQPGVCDTRPWPTLWNSQWDEDWTALLAGDDFDLDAVNQTLLECTGLPQDITVDHTDRSVPIDPDINQGPTAIERRWHTFSATLIDSGCSTPERPRSNGAGSQMRTRADGPYRQKLAESLRQREQPGILPSTNFLDLCLQAYFTHFQPIFPLVHAPTFQPSKKNAVLLLSICSIGSLFLGSSKALAHGISMFERLNKALLASWDTYLQANGSPSITAIKAALIGQIFGFLMGRPKDLIGIDMFSGCIISWARKVRLFSHDEENIGFVDQLQGDDDSVNAEWKTWADLEERRRMVLAIHIQDAELAKLHNHEPILRHGPEKLPQISSSELFTAPNSSSWKEIFLRGQRSSIAGSRPHVETPSPSLAPSKNGFLSCAILESIGALTCENRDCPVSWPVTSRRCLGLLIEHYETHVIATNPGRRSRSDPFCLAILWHSICMHLLTRFGDLERACGRDGKAAAQRSREYATSWAASPDATRTLLHSALIQQHFQSLPVGAEPAIHVPMALYYCGIAWTCFTRFGNGDSIQIHVDNTGRSDFPEMRFFKINQMQLFNDATSGIQWGKPESPAYFKIVDLLGKITHWKVSGSFASTLLSLVEDVSDLF